MTSHQNAATHLFATLQYVYGLGDPKKNVFCFYNKMRRVVRAPLSVGRVLSLSLPTLPPSRGCVRRVPRVAGTRPRRIAHYQ